MYPELALCGSTMCVLGVIPSSFTYLRSAKARFPLVYSFPFFDFGMKTLIYQTQAAGVVGRGSGLQKWEVSYFFSSYPTFLQPGHVVPDCPTNL